jgi:hypothetical protein
MNKNLEKNVKLLAAKYKEFVAPMLQYSFPNIDMKEIYDAVDYSIVKRVKNAPAKLVNNYKNKTINTTLLDVADYILSKEPIITGYGVMFNKHDSGIPNPIMDMVTVFLNNRDVDKKKMFQYPKGSELYNKYNLLQLLDKLDANGIYGVLGAPSSIYFNVFIAGSITMEGRNIISTSLIFFESFLANNIYFKNLNELIGYIRNIVCEKGDRQFNDMIYINHTPSVADVFDHIIQKSGFGYIPNTEDLDIIWDILCELEQEDLTRLFYKNNLFAFMSNDMPMGMVSDMLHSLDIPFLTPNTVPSCIEEKLHTFKNVLGEYVVYNHPYIDKLELNRHGPKIATIVSDTDSCIVNLDPWYQFILEKTKDVPIMVRGMAVSPILRIKKNDFGEYVYPDPIHRPEEIFKYDDERDVIYTEKMYSKLIAPLSQDPLRYSIINIIAYCLEHYVNDVLMEMTKHSNSFSEDRKCLIKMKNEFLFKRLIAALVAKSYASKLELQEGKRVPVEESLEIKGLRLKKSTLAAEPKRVMQKLLVEEILSSPEIKPINIINQLMILEKQIIASIKAGENKYLTPSVIKNISNYPDPMSLGQVKAAYVWNCLSDSNKFDFETRNSMYLVKTILNAKSIEKIKDKYPEEYMRLKEIFAGNVDFGNSKGYKVKEINSIAVPKDVSVPDWIFEFVDFEEIVSSNIKAFTPLLDAIGIQSFERKDVYYSNIISI